MNMNKDIERANALANQIRELGYAVTIFTPEELGDNDPKDIEESMVHAVNHLMVDTFGVSMPNESSPRGKWVPCLEGLPHHLEKRHPRDRRYVHPDIPADVVVAILWVEPSAATHIPAFWLPSVWMNGRFCTFESSSYQERGAMKAALDAYKANLPSPPARSLPSLWK